MSSRRAFLKMAAIAGAYAVLPGHRLHALGLATRVRPFQVPLAIPPVMKPVRSEAGRDYYRVTMRRGRVGILPGKRTTVWGFDGRFPGPTFRVQKGREIVVRRINALDVPTTTHVHGGKTPWRSDGHASLAIPPGEAYDYVYPNDQEACTLWYHDHFCKRTSRNNYMGLAGLYIIEDEAETDLNLPKGRYDIPLILQDRDFNADGSFDFKSNVDQIFGKIYLVNGRPMPYLKVANRKYRFRILNASPSRGYNLTLDNGDPLIQIGSDQGLLAAPYPASSIPVWPAERVEVIIDFSKYPVGSTVTLQDRTNPDNPLETRPVMQFKIAREESDDSSLPPVLRSIERLIPGPDVVEREFALSKTDGGRWVINNKPFDASRIDIRPRLGETEVWTFVNQSFFVHPMHVHLVRFQLLDRSDLNLSPGELGWKDTVRVDPSARVRVIMRFEGFTGKYMYHCHNLAHEDHSMMGQMQVRGGGDASRSEQPTVQAGYVGDVDPVTLPFRCDFKL